MDWSSDLGQYAEVRLSSVSIQASNCRLRTLVGALRRYVPRLLEEQRQVLAESGGKLTFEALENMTLLESCVKEALRM
jgi:hypothetical protein